MTRWSPCSSLQTNSWLDDLHVDDLMWYNCIFKNSTQTCMHAPLQKNSSSTHSASTYHVLYLEILIDWLNCFCHIQEYIINSWMNQMLRDGISNTSQERKPSIMGFKDLFRLQVIWFTWSIRLFLNINRHCRSPSMSSFSSWNHCLTRPENTRPSANYSPLKSRSKKFSTDPYVILYSCLMRIWGHVLLLKHKYLLNPCWVKPAFIVHLHASSMKNMSSSRRRINKKVFLDRSNRAFKKIKIKEHLPVN